jgi:hypothetical protein
MKKHWVLVGIGDLALCLRRAGAASDAEPAAQYGDRPDGARRHLALGKALPRAVTADGKPLPAGTYDVKLTARRRNRPWA